MARASKIIDGEIQIDPFMATLAAWISRALSGGEAVKISAITDKDPEFDPPKSEIQREKFHAMIGDIQKTGVIVMPGRKVLMSQYSLEKCKALLVMWFANEMRDMGTPIPNPPENFECPLTGESITIRPSTTKWGKKLTCIFVEWLYATGAMAGVIWSEKAIEAYNSYREAQS